MKITVEIDTSQMRDPDNWRWEMRTLLGRFIDIAAGPQWQTRLNKGERTGNAVTHSIRRPEEGHFTHLGKPVVGPIVARMSMAHSETIQEDPSDA
jgi:hypothetical protein